MRIGTHLPLQLTCLMRKMSEDVDISVPLQLRRPSLAGRGSIVETIKMFFVEGTQKSVTRLERDERANSVGYRMMWMWIVDVARGVRTGKKIKKLARYLFIRRKIRNHAPLIRQIVEETRLEKEQKRRCSTKVKEGGRGMEDRVDKSGIVTLFTETLSKINRVLKIRRAYVSNYAKQRSSRVSMVIVISTYGS